MLRCVAHLKSVANSGTRIPRELEFQRVISRVLKYKEEIVTDSSHLLVSASRIRGSYTNEPPPSISKLLQTNHTSPLAPPSTTANIMVVSSACLMPSLLTIPLPTKSDGNDRRTPFRELCADGCFSFWHKQGSGDQWNRHRKQPEGQQPQIREQPGVREEMEIYGNKGWKGEEADNGVIRQGEMRMAKW